MKLYTRLLYHLRPVQWLLFVTLTFLAALFLAWHALVKTNFLYPVWYEVLHIDQVISTYGPQNRYRTDFETTTKTERIRLFAALVEAVHHQGHSLDTLVYHGPNGRPIAPLLTTPEIIHLQDVANLIDQLLPMGQMATLGSLLSTSLLLSQRYTKPPVKKLLLGTIVGLMVGAGTILLIGPIDVFYGLHEQLFPKDHSWFFYYQDSLMTTLMKAPIIFGYIAVTLGTLTLLILICSIFLIRYLHRLLHTDAQKLPKCLIKKP
jgi:hypothetical protein